MVQQAKQPLAMLTSNIGTSLNPSCSIFNPANVRGKEELTYHINPGQKEEGVGTLMSEKLIPRANKIIRD